MNHQQEFDDRIAKVRQAMREQGLQTLFVFDAGRHNFLRMNYVAYLTDFIGVGPETGLVLPLEDAPVLYLAPVWDIPRAKEESSASDVRPFNELWNRLAKLSGKAGLVGREAMHVDLYDELVKTLKQTPVNAKDIVENMARCKGAFDLERLRKAAEIDDKITRALLEAIQRPPRLKLVGTGTPNIQLVTEPAEVAKQ